METKTASNMYYDPFTDTGAENFDPYESLERLEANYAEGRVQHDYAADNFVSSAEALMLDAYFLQRFDAVQAIADRLHFLCGEDHNVQAAVEQRQLASQQSEENSRKEAEEEEENKKKKRKKK